MLETETGCRNYITLLKVNDKMRQILSILLFLFTFSANAAIVDTVEIFSPSMKKNIKCIIIQPDVAKKETNQTFPVLYLLHGYSDNYSGWVTKATNLKKAVDDNNIIVVCPDGGFSSWYWDSPIDPEMKYETHITKEVLEYVEKNYRVKKEKKSRAIAGLSMGGHGALFLASRHKDIYGACVVFSGGTDITPFPKNWDMAKRLGDYNTHRERWIQYSAIYNVQKLNNNDIYLNIDCGTEDFFIGVNRILHQQLLELKIEHDYIERPGKHDWNYWNNAIVYQMYNLMRFFSGAKLKG